MTDLSSAPNLPISQKELHILALCAIVVATMGSSSDEHKRIGVQALNELMSIASHEQVLNIGTIMLTIARGASVNPLTGELEQDGEVQSN